MGRATHQEATPALKRVAAPPLGVSCGQGPLAAMPAQALIGLRMDAVDQHVSALQWLGS